MDFLLGTFFFWKLCVLSPELQECMETNERSAATGAPDREPQITPQRLKAQ